MGARNKNGGVTYKVSDKANLSKTLKIDTSKTKNSKKRTAALTKEYSSDRKSAKKAARKTTTSKTGITGGAAQAAKSYRAANPTTKKTAKKDTKKTTKKTTKNKQLTSNEALLLQNLSRTGTKDVVKKGTKNAEKTLRTSKAKTDEYKNLDKKVAKKKSKPSKTLTSNESLLLQNLTRTGTPDVVNKGLKGAEKTLRTSKAKTGEYKDLNKKVAEQDEKFLNSSPFAYGVMAGSSPIPLKETLEKQTGQKIDTSKAEDTLGYKAGYMAGLMGEYAATGGIARGAVEKSIKSIAKAAGTKASKEAVKKATEEATKQVAKNGSKLTELGKRVLTGAAADTITGVPTNALEAGKATSKAPDGEKGKTFARSMAVNTAFDVGMGAGGEAVSAAMKAIRKRAAAKAASNAEPANTLKATESADALKATEQETPAAPQTEANVKSPQTAETLSEGTIAQPVEKTPSNRKIKAQRTQPVKERLAAIREAREEVPEAPANASEVVKNAEQRKIQQIAEQKAGGDIEGARVMLTSAKEYIDGLKKTYEEERKKLVDYYEGYVREYKGKGVETYLVPADDSYYEFKARVNTSFNDNWYRDWYKVHHRPPAKKNAREIAEGIVDDIFRGESKDFPMEEMEELYKAIQSERDIYDSFAAEYNLTKEQRTELADIFDDEETKGIFIDADEYFEKNFPEFDALAKDLGADVNKNKPVYKESTAAVNEVRPEGEKVMYETETHARREQAAKDRLATDYDGEYKDLMAKEEYTSEDLATMGELLNREKTNFSRFHKLTRKAGEVSSRKGQELEAVKHIKENTAAGKVIKGEQASSRNVRNLEKENPRKLKQTKKQADETIEEVGKAVDTTVKETLQEVGKLAKATQGKAVKTETKALNTAIDETIADAVNVLDQYKGYTAKKITNKVTDEFRVKPRKGFMQKAFEEMQKDVFDLMKKPVKSKAEKEAAIDKFVRLTKERQDNISDYDEVFDMVEESINKMYGNEQALLDDALDTLTEIRARFREGYSEENLTKVIDEVMKDVGIDMKKLITRSEVDKSNAKATLAYIMESRLREVGVDDELLERIMANVNSQFDTRLEGATMKFLYDKVKPRAKKTSNKTAASNVVDLINTGAYWERNIPEELEDLLAMHSDAAVAKAVDEAIKQTDIKLKDVMGKSNKAKSEVKQQLVDTFSDNLRLYGVNDEGIEFFKETVEALFDSKLEKAAKQYLTQRFAFKNKTERKSMIEDVLELIRMGAYDDADIVALMRAKNGVNVLTPQQAKQVADYMDYYEAHPDTREGAEALAKANKIIANLEESTRGDKIRSVQRISMLFNPKTWFSRNMGGNVLLAGAENIKDIPAAAIDALVALKTGERTTQGITRAKLKEQGKGVAKGTKEQLLDIRRNVNTARTNTKYEKPNKDVWNNKPMNTLDNLIGQLLQLGDRPFYEAAYGARKAELEALVKKGKSKLTAEEIEEEAKRVALDRVFQADTNLSQASNQIRDALNKVSGGFAGNLLFPFVQTPANILSKLLDYSPAGLLKAVGELSKTRKGTFNQKVFVDTLGRTFTGAGVITLGYALADKGLMSVDLYAQSGKEQQVQKAYEKQGLQSYAIQLEDGTSFTIDWANPIGSLLIMGAECYYGGANESDFVTSLFGGAQSAADSVLNQSFLQGLSTLFSSDGSISGGFGKAMLSATSQPLPSVIQALTRVVDPYKRETYDENPVEKQLNVLKSKIPGLSKTLPRKKDVTGEDVLQYQGRGTLSKVLEAYLYPANISERKLNNVNDEAVRVYEATGEQSALLRIGTKSFDYDDKKYTLKNNKEFSRFQEVQGEYAYDELSKLFSTKKYKNMTDSEKASAISEITLEAKKKAEEDYLIHNKGYTQTELDFDKLSPSEQEGFANTSLTKDAYIEAMNTADKYNKDGKNKIKQDEFKEYVREEDVDSSTARELWIAYGWSPNTNPY